MYWPEPWTCTYYIGIFIQSNRERDPEIETRLMWQLMEILTKDCYTLEQLSEYRGKDINQFTQGI
ncbi:MAG: hypothetical protein AMS17_00645 [Spirochaetes bacterium DG_61]|jgi:hypothetical protein|nr:MAG: hypothetical protein AMS17_00645 [Spirochaetes bacterium DG_61]